MHLHDPNSRGLPSRGLTARRSMVRGIVAPVVWVVSASLIAQLSLTAQAAGSGSVIGPNTFLNSLSKDEQRAESPAGDLNYATELIQMVASHVSRGDAAQLARRLASADQAARRDPRKYVPETAVAAAFNALMARAQGSYATPLGTDTQTVHTLREVLAANSPDLTTVKTHSAFCLPDEAVLLTFLLLTNDGKVVVVPLGQPPPRDVTSGPFADAAVDAKARLEQYVAAHSEAIDLDLFTRMLTEMGIRR